MENKGAFVRILVSNVEQSLKFYTETLGFILAQKPTSEFGVVETPVGSRFPARISLTTQVYPGQTLGKCESISLGIFLESQEDLEIAVKELKEKGVVFTSDFINDGLSVFIFLVDPDKNPLYMGANRQISA
jgi:catechol 2,3-dioxygenase-like lactoylglutathione lyase family enzyme